jgi:ethanolamine-phosphate cytidylyltransferase
MDNREEPFTSSNLLRKSSEDNFVKGPVVSSFLTTGWRLQEFCNDKVPKENDVIMYIDGAWDILHVGHIETLKKAKEKCDFLYVGVHDDITINKHRGKNYPILNLQERVFNLLAMKYVDDVVIAAPWIITQDLIKSLKISKVLHGTHAKYDENFSIQDENDPFAIPKSLGIYEEIQSDYDLNNDILVRRIIERRDHYVNKYNKKSISEKGYYENKNFLNEI